MNIIEPLVVLLFERTPILNWLNGKKRLIGTGMVVIGALIEGAKHAFPELALVGQVNSYYVLLAGILTKVLGDLHADVKDARG